MRKVRFFSIALIVLALLVIAGDRIGQVAIERVVAGRIQDALATPGSPSVDLGGAPFLPELASQDFADVKVDIRDADAGGLRIERLRATLTGVSQSGGGGVFAETIRGEGLIGYDALTRAARPLEVSFGGDGMVAVTAAVRALGQELSASASGRPRIEGNRLIIDPMSATTSAGGGEAASAAAQQIPDIVILLRDLPAGVEIDLAPTEAGVEFTFRGRDVTL